ncbi:polyprenol phosphomannose-dependent alpha 1,6 mannosyltransferase MptB [Corynebacterium renale]|uniref:polyprenol phosphomannose-dependent alpha 1,6 mannosyltransferase MptB n=1 Tax=Corynebacterium renale TaxID=1724 RepID=UPI002163CE70|nr:polyprenol phosphomannose-dependent alpha 1,6 mannosyltransferase MptB [Corynebacterium renale]
MKQKFSQRSVLWRALTRDLPRLGAPGSRSAELHSDSALVTAVSGSDLASRRTYQGISPVALVHVAFFRWLGVLGSLIIGLAALGAGALPVVHSPYADFPGGSLLAQMLPTATVVCFVGVVMLVVAWLGLSPFAGIRLIDGSPRRHGLVSEGMLWRTFAAWVFPLLFTAPLFTQDVYSYLAQGSITNQGMDPYSAGPIDLLGVEHDLARSVPFIWAHSPSPYGPVALGFASLVSSLTNDSIVLGVLFHRLLAVVGIVAMGWALSHLARRCGVPPASALWLGMLNPLVLLHLVGGIHNEALMFGFMMVGLEFGFRGNERLRDLQRIDLRTIGWWGSAVALQTCGGLVKVSAFLSLAFFAMALARDLRAVGRNHFRAMGISFSLHVLIVLATVATVTLLTGIGLGWITGQGGAAQIRSWMSLTTDIGVISGWIGMVLGLGDHTDAMLSLTRTVGIVIAGAWTARMLYATYVGNVYAMGGLGVSMFVVVILFPVVHPWYILWAVVPLAAWANRRFFHVAVAAYSSIVSLIVLPRGLSLPPGTVSGIYAATTVIAVLILGLGWWLLRRRGLFRLH